MEFLVKKSEFSLLSSQNWLFQPVLIIQFQFITSQIIYKGVKSQLPI
jgi:hypothetical protein